MNLDYGIYKNVRNASWQCLIDCSIFELPIKPVQIANSYGIHCKSVLGDASGEIKLVDNESIVHVKTKKKCTKKAVSKDYIENYVIQKCKELLTTANIMKIAKEVVSACNKSNDMTNLHRLENQLKEIERKQRNLMNAILECDIEMVRKSLYEEVPRLEAVKKSLLEDIETEERGMVRLTEQQVRFFLTALKNGDVDDVKYRKALISVFVNKIYLYDDKITFIFNSGAIPVTVDADLIDFIEEQNLSANNANEFKFSTKCSTKSNIIRQRLHNDYVTVANENRCLLIQGQRFLLEKKTIKK